MYCWLLCACVVTPSSLTAQQCVRLRCIALIAPNRTTGETNAHCRVICEPTIALFGGAFDSAPNSSTNNKKKSYQKSVCYLSFLPPDNHISTSRLPAFPIEYLRICAEEPLTIPPTLASASDLHRVVPVRDPRPNTHISIVRGALEDDVCCDAWNMRAIWTLERVHHDHDHLPDHSGGGTAVKSTDGLSLRIYVCIPHTDSPIMRMSPECVFTTYCCRPVIGAAPR